MENGIYFSIKIPGYSSDLLHFPAGGMNIHEQFFLFFFSQFTFLATLLVPGDLKKNCFGQLSFRNCDILSAELLSCCPILLGEGFNKSISNDVSFHLQSVKSRRDSEVLLETILSLRMESNIKGNLRVKYEVVLTCG